MKVPDVLMSGNHAKIEQWRMEQTIKRTYERRPDLLEGIELTKEQKAYLQKLKRSK